MRQASRHRASPPSAVAACAIRAVASLPALTTAVAFGALAAAGGCSPGGTTPADATSDTIDPHARCGSTAEPMHYLGDKTTVLADITGDDLADDVALHTVSDDVYRLDIGTAATVTLPWSDAFYLVVGAADLDADGTRDLVIGLPWTRRVVVIAGPLAGELDAEADALLSLSGPPRDGGLEPLYGIAVLIADLDLDGARDVVVGAPAEGEEGCLGQLEPRVFLGPFARGAQLTEDDVSLTLPRAGKCTGEHLRCTADGFEVYAFEGSICYALPLTSGTPCP